VRGSGRSETRDTKTLTDLDNERTPMTRFAPPSLSLSLPPHLLPHSLRLHSHPLRLDLDPSSPVRVPLGHRHVLAVRPSLHRHRSAPDEELPEELGVGAVGDVHVGGSGGRGGEVEGQVLEVGAGGVSAEDGAGVLEVPGDVDDAASRELGEDPVPGVEGGEL